LDWTFEIKISGNEGWGIVEVQGSSGPGTNIQVEFVAREGKPETMLAKEDQHSLYDLKSKGFEEKFPQSTITSGIKVASQLESNLRRAAKT
jgi:hypothetical protein